MSASGHYIPALGYRWFTGLYDPIARIATRERTFKRALLDEADLRAREQVLDVGCGTGTLAIMAAQRAPTATISGLDGDVAVLERARLKAHRAGVEIHLDHGSADALPFADGSFDVVLSSLLFHHLTTATKRQALAEAYRVLTPGGRMVLADWGRPHNAALRLAFLSVQLLDGFATTDDNAQGLIPGFIADAGFVDVREARRFATATGALAIWSARRSTGV